MVSITGWEKAKRTITYSLPQALRIVYTHTHDEAGMTIPNKVGLLHRVEKGILNVPAAQVHYMQPPRQLWTIEIGQKTSKEITELDTLKAKA